MAQITDQQAESSWSTVRGSAGASPAPLVGGPDRIAGDRKADFGSSNKKETSVRQQKRKARMVSWKANLSRRGRGKKETDAKDWRINVPDPAGVCTDME